MTRFFNRSILNSSLRHHALLVGMLHLAHFGDGIRKFNNCRMSVAPRQDHMHHFWLLLQPLGHLGRIEHPVADRVIYFIQYAPAAIFGNPVSLTLRRSSCSTPLRAAAAAVVAGTSSSTQHSHSSTACGRSTEIRVLRPHR